MKLNPNFVQASLLVVDDDEAQWQMIQRALRLALPEVQTQQAAGAQQALHLLETGYREHFELPKLIQLDLTSPNPAGNWTLLSRIHQLGTPFSQVPVMMVSDSAPPAAVRQAYEEGVCSYLVKPSTYAGWVDFYKQIRAYWWETVILPVPNGYL